MQALRRHRTHYENSCSEKSLIISLRPEHDKIQGRTAALALGNDVAHRSKDTKPEMLVRKALHRLGFRFRLHGRDLPGRPDIVFQKSRSLFKSRDASGMVTRALMEGCKVKREYWVPKLLRNKERDISQ